MKENDKFPLLDLLKDPESKARHSDPNTSKLAARSAKYTPIRLLILKLLSENIQGLTTFEMSEITKIPRDIISPNIKPLITKRLVIRDGNTRLNPKTNAKSLIIKLNLDVSDSIKSKIIDFNKEDYLSSLKFMANNNQFISIKKIDLFNLIEIIKHLLTYYYGDKDKYVKIIEKLEEKLDV